ncbi:BgTH12-04708 [Blumeria graminis f. sp. triticale]|uniref:Bgt-51119 n=2 Tax=Blumeria graminis TaxID=34373 RepID=A0A9X9L7G1_BLUGR|nr:BgTH12-04708 [Blumeria graminis f. sp. triticale]VCU39195.1 Bgt-51119 [Blumeria graminis f. sp. tritici]
MKFLRTATAAVLANLLLLVLAVCGKRHYKCDHGRPFSEEYIISKARYASADDNRYGNLAVPTGESYISLFFANPLLKNSLDLGCYLIQVYGQPPKYQFSQYVDNKWKLCTLESRS